MSTSGSLGCGLVEGRWLLLVCACWGKGGQELASNGRFDRLTMESLN